MMSELKIKFDSVKQKLENHKVEKEYTEILKQPQVPMHTIYDIIRKQDPDDRSMDV